MVLLRRLALEAIARSRRAGKGLARAADGHLRLRQPRGQQLEHAFVGHVARGGNDDVVVGVGGAVVLDERALADRRDHVGPSDHRPSERVAAEDRLRDDVVDEVLRVVVDHRDLLQHDFALRVDVGEGRVVDHPDDHVERGLEPVVRHAGVDERRLARRGRVQLPAEPVEDLRDLLRGVRARPLEEQVLDEVRDPGARVGLVARPGPDPEAERHGADARNVLGDHPLAGRELREVVGLHRPILAFCPA